MGLSKYAEADGIVRHSLLGVMPLFSHSNARVEEETGMRIIYENYSREGIFRMSYDRVKDFFEVCFCIFVVIWCYLVFYFLVDLDCMLRTFKRNYLFANIFSLSF